MYSFDDVSQALEAGLLSEGLFRLEQFARSQGNTDLADWAAAELTGWNSTSEDFPDYRKMTVQVVDGDRYPIRRDEGGWLLVTLPLAQGVQVLQQHVGEGMTVYTDDAPSGWGISISREQIQMILGAGRQAARRKLLHAFPKQRARYPAPGFTKLVQDSQLASLLERRWAEANEDFQAGAYLSTLIMLGSILEGVLLDKALTNPAVAQQSSKAPKDRAGQVRPTGEWTLAQLIDVAHECGWLSKGMKDFSDTLREYRNFIHPREQLRNGAYYPDAQLCGVAWEVTQGALADLSK